MLLLLFVLLFGTVFYTCTYQAICIYFQSVKPLANLTIIKDKTTDGFVVNTPGCKIPDFHPFDNQVKKFIKKPTAPVCNNGTPALFESDLTSVYLLNSSLAAYNITDKQQLSCCYNVFWRVDVPEHNTDNNIVYSEDCYNFTEKVFIDYDFIRVTCQYKNKSIYKDMFSFVPISSIKRLPDTQYPAPLSVLMIGIDAVSRLNLHRQLGKTVNYIKSIGAYEMLGFNKVGDNTFPNLMPVLTGQNESELIKSCWPEEHDHFDNCSFIWKDFKQQGFVTAYGEDASWMGLFNYQRRGFHKQPTDYGYNYFSRHVEHEIGNVGFMNVDLCEGARLVYKDFQKYIIKFVTTMSENQLPYFGFFWGVSLSHDELNMPSLGDDDYFNLFKNFKDQGFLENTAVIFLSDHGIRWGGIRETYQGRMEERLPFVFVLLPDWFKIQYPQAIQNLAKNTRRLTTPYDLHETLRDLLNPYNMTENITPNAKGISMFKEINGARTCKDAGIVSHWCTCQQSVDVNTKNAIVIKSASIAVNHINKQLEGYAQCANLVLAEITNARLMTHKEEGLTGINKIQDYLITIKTTPGNAHFEVTVRYKPDDKVFNVIGSVSRLNLYGNQSSCISDFHLKLYCYCKNILPI